MNSMKSIALVVLASILLALPTFAQSEDRYDYCRDKAREYSGYYGPVPAEYEESSNALKGAVKGASNAAALSWITGGDKEDRKRAAKRGAALGGLIAAAKKAEQDKKRRENERKRRAYEVELTACMAGGRKD